MYRLCVGMSVELRIPHLVQNKFDKQKVTKKNFLNPTKYLIRSSTFQDRYYVHLINYFLQWKIVPFTMTQILHQCSHGIIMGIILPQAHY